MPARSMPARPSLVTALLLGFVLLGSAPAWAQEDDEDIEEIVVLGAESEAAEDFAAGDAVTGFDASDLEALGAQSVEDLAAFTPNLEIVTSGATTPTFFIRGVGLNDFNANASSAVAIYQDDVNKNAQGLQLGQLFDVEAVNILRGPQGTGLARNASAGAIKIYSRKPTGEFGGYLRGSLGNYEYRDLEGAVEAPIYEDYLAARGAFRLSEREGIGRNYCGGLTGTTVGVSPPYVGVPLAQCFGGLGFNVNRFSRPGAFVPAGLPDRVNDLDRWAARGTLLFQPTLDLTWLTGVQYTKFDQLSRLGQSYGTRGGFFGGGDSGQETNAGFVKPEVADAINAAFLNLLDQGFTQQESRVMATQAVARDLADDLDDKPYSGYYSHVGPTQNDVLSTYLRGELVLFNGWKIKSVTGYDTYDRLVDVDLDFSPEVIATIKTEDEVVQVTEDLSIDGDFGDLLPNVRWSAGGFGLYEELDVHVENTLLPSARAIAVRERDYIQRIRSFGGYGNFEVDFWDDFTLDGGVRYNWEEKSGNFVIMTPAGEIRERLREIFQDPTGTLRLTYRFREDTHMYWKYTRGYKAGHFNATASPTRGVTTAEPEEIDAWETGLRGTWFDSRVILDAQLFYYSYNNYQIFTVQTDFGELPSFVVLNADRAEVYGSELDLQTRPWPGAFFNMRFSWLESQFLEFNLQQFTVQQVFGPGGVETVSGFREVDASGNRLLNSPQFKVSLTAEQRLPLGRFGSLTPRYDVVWTHETFFDPTEGKGFPEQNDAPPVLPEGALSQRPYFLHNVRLGYTPPTGNVEVAVWVRNLTDKAYRTFAADARVFTQSTLNFVGDPRTYGIDVSFTF